MSVEKQLLEEKEILPLIRGKIGNEPGQKEFLAFYEYLKKSEPIFKKKIENTDDNKKKIQKITEEKFPKWSSEYKEKRHQERIKYLEKQQVTFSLDKVHFKNINPKIRSTLLSVLDVWKDYLDRLINVQTTNPVEILFQNSLRKAAEYAKYCFGLYSEVHKDPSKKKKIKSEIINQLMVNPKLGLSVPSQIISRISMLAKEVNKINKKFNDNKENLENQLERPYNELKALLSIDDNNKYISKEDFTKGDKHIIFRKTAKVMSVKLDPIIAPTSAKLRMMLGKDKKMKI